MSIKNAIIVGDTKNFHIGSRVNCFYLTKIIGSRYNLLGLFGGEDFFFDSYDDFLKRISSFKLYRLLKKSDIIFCHGEGMIEANSIYGDAIFYLAKYIRTIWPAKKIYLINFSCFDKKYGDWKLFDILAPRDLRSFNCLRLVHKNVRLGFDCSVLQKIGDPKVRGEKRIIPIFRGRRDVFPNEIKQVRNIFKEKEAILVSSFWEFEHGNPIKPRSLDDLKKIFKKSHLVISSSFHGIVFSIRFGIPFIPITTLNTSKNESITADVLGRYYKKRSFSDWLKFYKNQNNYRVVSSCLKQTVPKLQQRALIYSKLDFN